MSRWLSPQKAALRQMHVTQEAEARRKQRRNSWLLVIGIALASISLVIADYCWLRARARERHQQHLERYHQNELRTNQAAGSDAAIPIQPDRKAKHE